MELRLRATWHLDSGPGTPDTRVLRYEVEGLPNGQKAEIAELPGRNQWQILRTQNDKVGKWAGDFDSPEAALSALKAELAATT